MLRFPLLVASIVLLFPACPPPAESVVAECDLTGWKAAKSRDERRGEARFDFVPDQEGAETWTKRIRVEYLDDGRPPIRKAAEKVEREARKRCGDRIEWKILEQDSESVLYEWSVQGCAKVSDRCEIARLMTGFYGTHRIAYTERGRALDPRVREERLAMLRSAHLVFAMNHQPRLRIEAATVPGNFP